MSERSKIIRKFEIFMNSPLVPSQRINISEPAFVIGYIKINPETGEEEFIRGEV